MDIHALVEAQHKYYQSGATRPVEFRIEALRKLQRAIRANEKLLADALKQDLNKSETESYMCETGMVLEELSYPAGAVSVLQLHRPRALRRGAHCLAVELSRAALPESAYRRNIRGQLRRGKAVRLCRGYKHRHSQADRRHIPTGIHCRR